MVLGYTLQQFQKGCRVVILATWKSGFGIRFSKSKGGMCFLGSGKGTIRARLHHENVF